MQEIKNSFLEQAYVGEYAHLMRSNTNTNFTARIAAKFDENNLFGKNPLYTQVRKHIKSPLDFGK